MSEAKNVRLHETEEAEYSASKKTLLTTILTGVVFWASLFALLFFCLTS